ncbi:poly [ADP-ribose] polymerase protein [Dioscorea alata]|uniref:Poly [ADP-ribose] polymerase protein n=1 Tax=Dioscorea alata TaxID=55571 RepID=A0ACB7VUW5_DIOAL|nr:poly [ADP-ribose] polymerase protein [Dioscorea alata]
MAAAKLRVEELRAQLAHRGLDSAGTKPVLVKRLEEAIRKEEEEKESLKDDNTSNATSGGRKRQRDSSKDDPEPGEAIERLQEMGVRELRELAASRGLQTNGLKRELIQRLSTDMLKDSGDAVEAKEVEESKEKMVTATKKGGAVLDQWLPDNIKSSFHVLQQGEEIYDAILNQTNVGDNNNKFYVIQVLESDDGGKFMVYNRWGRVGIKGQDKLLGPYTSVKAAINEFKTKFFDKTKNHWSGRKAFICKPKCYTWLEMDYSETDKATVSECADSSVGSQLRETKLDQCIAKFISLICNISMMKQQMLEIGYNAEKLPLGKLSKSTILKGYDVLRRISEVMGQSNQKELEELSGEFYTVIPHDFGFKKMREFVIDTPSKLKGKLEMVAALGEIEVATKLLQDDCRMQKDPLYYRYQQLHCDLNPVEADSEEFLMIRKYMLNTHAKTHSNYKVDIQQIFKVSRHGEVERFSKFSNTKNRMLLWHGSRLTNWTGILSQGLRIAPPEAPVTGYMFGKGVYFADMFSKSANYCFASNSSSSGVLLLCEVALGEMSELLVADHNANQLPPGKLSTKGVGATAPNMSESYSLEDVIVPLGKPKKQTDHQGSLLYNEYIVYDVDQIQMRYVVHVNFNFKR